MFAILVFVVYDLNRLSKDLNVGFKLKYCLFANVKLTKNPDPYKYSYCGWGIGLILFHFFHMEVLIGVKKVIIFKVDHNSSMHIEKIYLSSWWKHKDQIIPR